MVLDTRATGARSAGVIRQFVMKVGMRCEGRGWREQQRVIVMSAANAMIADDAIAARPVLDHDRLAPSR